MSGIKCIELIDIPTCKASYLWWHKVRFFLGWLNPSSLQHNSPHHHHHHDLPITMIMHATPMTRPNFTKSYHSYNDQNPMCCSLSSTLLEAKKKKKMPFAFIYEIAIQIQMVWCTYEFVREKNLWFFFFLKTFVRVFFSFLFIFILDIRKTDWTLKNYSLFFSVFFFFFFFFLGLKENY